MARTLGTEIRNVRQLKGLSLKATAGPAGLSPTYLQKLERNEVESPSPHRLRRIAETLGLDYGDLFKLAGYPVSQAPNETSGSSDAGADSLSGDDVSLLRKAFLSDDFVSDEELEELARYLGYLRDVKKGQPG